MRKAARFAVPMLALLLAFQAGAAEGATRLFGTGSTVTCDTTPNAGSDVDDTSVANALERTVACRNDSSEPVYIGGSSVSTGGEKVVPGGRYAATLAPSVVPKCYAANSTSITCTESFGSTPAVGTMGGTGSRVELLASGTNTSLSTASVEFVTFNVPTWAHSVACLVRVNAISGAGASNLKTQFWGYDSSSNLLTATAIAEAGLVAAPGLGSTSVMECGPNALVLGSTGTTTTAFSSVAHGGITWCPRRIQFARVLSAAPATSWTLGYECYGYGG